VKWFDDERYLEDGDRRDLGRRALRRALDHDESCIADSLISDHIP
jgi:hypothetical protein